LFPLKFSDETFGLNVDRETATRKVVGSLRQNKFERVINYKKLTYSYHLRKLREFFISCYSSSSVTWAI